MDSPLTDEQIDAAQDAIRDAPSLPNQLEEIGKLFTLLGREVKRAREDKASKDAEIAALHSRIDALENGAVHTGKVLRDADIEIARLREALKPFAEVANEFQGHPDGRGVLVAMRHFHAALAALEEK